MPFLLTTVVTTKLIEPLHFFELVLNGNVLGPDPKKLAQYSAYLSLFNTLIHKCFDDIITLDTYQACKIMLQISTLLLQGVEYSISKIQEPSISALDQPFSKGEPALQAIASSSLKLLVYMFTKQRILIFILLGKEEHHGTYFSDFSSSLQALGRHLCKY